MKMNNVADGGKTWRYHESYGWMVFERTVSGDDVDADVEVGGLSRVKSLDINPNPYHITHRVITRDIRCNDGGSPTAS